MSLHADILDAIKARDEAAARTKMTELIETTVTHLGTVLKSRFLKVND